MFSETGWIATTTNYLWVSASLLGFLGITLAKKIDGIHIYYR